MLRGIKEKKRNRGTVDPKYRDRTVAMFISTVMKSGKKPTAEKIVYGAFEQVAKKYRKDDIKDGEAGGVVDLFKKALENIKPKVEVKSRRVGGATYQVPTEVRPARQTTLAMRWLIDAARKRPPAPMVKKLAAEIYDATHLRGAAVKRRFDTLKMAEANRAFSHYRW